MKNSIYLDYNATAPIRPEVIELMGSVMTDGGNPSSVHGSGRRALSVMEKARSQIGLTVNSKPQEVIFTSGGTESNNLALKAFADRPLMVSQAEHDSVLATALTQDVLYFPILENGIVDIEAFSKQLGECAKPPLVSLMLGNNETGVIQPIKEIADLVHDMGGLIHTDAIQALGKIPVDFRSLGVDMMSLSAHKIGGPQGMGALILREGLAMQSVQKGGGQEKGRRGGTENVAGIAGFGLSASLAGANLDTYKEIEILRDEMESFILAASPGSLVYGKGVQRLPNTSCLSMPGVGSELQVMNFDLADIAVSAGSACSSGKVKASHVLTAMGASGTQASEAIRISLGWLTTKAELDKFIQTWEQLYKRKSPKFAA
ncbi:MAG: cysteine desulfurase family protein [Sneathiella sp.]